MPIPIGQLDELVKAGLPNSQPRRDRARRNLDFWRNDGDQHEELWQRDAESAFDLQGRPHRQSGLSREVIEVLTDHLYCPGPSRTWSDAAGQEYLGKVYSQNHIDALMLRADQLAHLNDFAAIQVDAGEGDPDRPITLRLWGAEECDYWCDPDDPCKIVAVCTIDRYDLQTRYRLWTVDEVRTYLTSKAEGTAGGRTADLVAKEPNTYGAIPFAFVRYELPVGGSETPGVGDLLVGAEIRVDDRLSKLDEAIAKHLNPIPYAKGVPADWRPILEPQRFVRLPGRAPTIGGSGGYEPGADSELGYLQAKIDIAGVWDDILRFLNQVLEACRAPLSAVRMEQAGVASGISLIVEQAPLLTRARKRRGPFGVFEADLARLILVCGGNHYGTPALVTSAKAGQLSLGWPQPSIPIPTNDRLELLVGEVTAGYKSQLMAMQEWYGVPRDQALQIARQIELDQADLKKVAPSLVAPPPAKPDDEPDGDEDPPGGSKSDPEDPDEDPDEDP